VGGHLSYFDGWVRDLFAMQEIQIRLLLLLRLCEKTKRLWRQHSYHAQKAASKLTASQYSSNVKKVLDQIIVPSEF
jgi:hypothetical protein